MKDLTQIQQIVDKANESNISISLTSLYQEISHQCVNTIHTLGPENTSSHLVALKITRGNADIDVTLHSEGFESIFDVAANQEANSLALVPSAYSRADLFFMSQHTNLVGCFSCDTPPYHLAWPRQRKNPLRSSTKRIRVATHAAPIGLLPRLLSEQTSYQMLTYPSTVMSAHAALNGEADVALCNLTTINTLNMDYLPTGIVVNMTWNLFFLHQRKSWSIEENPNA